MTTAELNAFRKDKMPGFVYAWFSTIKERVGYSAAITAYDREIQDNMEAAVAKMLAAGVPEDMFVTDESIDKRILLAIALYVSAYNGLDRTDTQGYLKLFSDSVKNLQLEDGGAWDVDVDD